MCAQPLFAVVLPSDQNFSRCKHAQTPPASNYRITKRVAKKQQILRLAFFLFFSLFEHKNSFISILSNPHKLRNSSQNSVLLFTLEMEIYAPAESERLGKALYGQCLRLAL
jgi:hypothetical protein